MTHPAPKLRDRLKSLLRKRATLKDRLGCVPNSEY